MPAPVVTVLAVVSTIGAVYAFHQFVYEPHIAPKIELWAEEFIARRRARRMQQQGLIAVPASIPLRRRHRRENDSKHSDSTLSDTESSSDSDSGARKSGPSTQRRGSQQPSSSFVSAHGTDFNSNVAREVGEWRSEVSRSQTSNNLRHRTNRGVHALDESINPIPHPTMSPTHVIFDTSGLTTPTTTSIPSIISSPPAQVSPLLTTTTESTLHPSPNRAPAPLGPSTLAQPRTPLPPSSSPIPHHAGQANQTPTSPVPPTTTSPIPNVYSPPSISSPIPSLSQSYPQELDRERDVELLSRPSSGTSSPFTTFSPFVAPQALSPFAVVQPLDHNPSAENTHPSRSPNPFLASRSSSPSQHTVTDAEYRSLPVSPTSPPSELSSPVHITHEPIRSPSPSQEGGEGGGGPSQQQHPEPLINFTSPNPISPRSPHFDLSDLEFESDFDVLSDQGSEGSGRSWAGVSSGSGPSDGRR